MLHSSAVRDRHPQAGDRTPDYNVADTIGAQRLQHVVRRHRQADTDTAAQQLRRLPNSNRDWSEPKAMTTWTTALTKMWSA